MGKNINMKLEIETDNLPELINALNNAIIAYDDIRRVIWLMGGISDGVDRKWDKLINHNAIDFDDVTIVFDGRLKILKKLYKQLEDKQDNK